METIGNERSVPASILTDIDTLKATRDSADNTLIDILLDIADQMDQNNASEITCAQLGMAPNSTIEGANNYTKLVNAIQAGKKILIDKKYYINAPVARPIITRDIIWEGISNDGELVLKGASYFFEVSSDCRQINIRGVKFLTEDGDSGRVIFYAPEKQMYFDKIIFNRIVTKGNMSLARLYFPKNLNPEKDKFGVGTFEFSQSEIYNTQMSFLVFLDCPCEKYHIWGNKVNNFDYVFFNFGVSNDGLFSEQVTLAHKLLLVHDNFVYNDDTWWGGSGSGSYYCFGLFEGQKVLWHHNHVEGIKTTYVRATYDCYLSASEVDYNNNIWKNNICFNSKKEYNTLMRAKGGGGIKRYTNNHYVCEKSYAERLSQSPDLLWTQFYESTSRSRRWEIRDNTFDVYHLSCPASSVNSDEIWIENNEITCERLDNNILIYGIYYDESNPYDYGRIVHKVNNNKIRIRSVGKICLVKNGTYDSRVDISKCPSVEVKGNYIESYEASYLLYQLHTNNLEISDNTIIITSPAPITGWGLIYNSYWENYKNLHNVIQQPNSRFYTHRSQFNKFILEDFIVSDIGGVDTHDSLLLPNNSIDTLKYRYTRHYEIDSAIGEASFDLKFDYYYDPVSSYNYVAYVNTSGVPVAYRIAKTGDMAGEGFGDNPKLVGASSGYAVRFYNTTSQTPWFYFSSWPVNSKTTHITTRTVVIGKFLINQERDVLNLSSDLGGLTAIDIPDGIYDGYQMAATLQTAMNANRTLSGNSIVKFKVTWDIVSQRFTIDAGEGHTIAYINSGSDAGSTLGFNSNISAAQSIRSQVACG